MLQIVPRVMSETTTTMTDPLGWNSTTWDTLSHAVDEETQRTKIAQKILPLTFGLLAIALRRKFKRKYTR
jgi:hypothetical protein